MCRGLGAAFSIVAPRVGDPDIHGVHGAPGRASLWLWSEADARRTAPRPARRAALPRAVIAASRDAGHRQQRPSRPTSRLVTTGAFAWGATARRAGAALSLRARTATRSQRLTTVDPERPSSSVRGLIGPRCSRDAAGAPRSVIGARRLCGWGPARRAFRRALVSPRDGLSRVVGC
jgi:hypothetical protein